MPGGDGTGPLGQGPRTGRGMGRGAEIVRVQALEETVFALPVAQRFPIKQARLAPR